MNREIIHRTVILLLEENSETDICFVKEWFKKSRFLTNETSDVFDALEEISDFTTRSRPDVVLLEVESLRDDFIKLKKMIQTASGKCEFPVFALSESGKIINDNECFEGNLAQVKARLDQMIPKQARAAGM
jgi:hypothetical protein